MHEDSSYVADRQLIEKAVAVLGYTIHIRTYKHS